MAYGEPVIQAWDVKYLVNLNRPGGGWITITAATTDPSQEALVDVAVQEALDLLVAAGWTVDSATKSMPAGCAITPTPPE